MSVLRSSGSSVSCVQDPGSRPEILRVRRLINRVKADLDDLTPEDRAQIEEAVAVVRRGRTVMLGLPKVRQPMPDVRPWRTE